MSGSLTTNTSVPFNNNIQDFHVTIGTYTATMGTFGEFNIAGSPPSAFELDARVIKPTGDNVNSLAPDVFALDYLYNSADPTITGGAFNLFFESGKEAGNVIGSVTSLTAVPLPAAAVLFGAGLAALIGLGAGRLRNPRIPQA